MCFGVRALQLHQERGSYAYMTLNQAQFPVTYASVARFPHLLLHSVVFMSRRSAHILTNAELFIVRECYMAF
jgi:hypothetical protein